MLQSAIYLRRPCYNGGVPKIVDHEERRVQLADTVLALVEREGFEGVSVRTVAAEAGWSVGAVRHYFTSMTELLRFSFDLMIERMRERFQALIDSDRPNQEKARLLLEELLPMDERRYSEQRLWLELVTRSRHDPALKQAAIASGEGTRWLVRGAVILLRELDVEDITQPLPDPRLEQLVKDLNVYVDGLWLAGLGYRPDTPEELRDDLARALGYVAEIDLGEPN